MNFQKKQYTWNTKPKKVLSLIFKTFESSIFDFWLEAFFFNFEFRFSNFSCGHLFLSRFDFDARNFLQKNLGRRDRFRPKIVEIGAILAIFEPFEVLKIHMPLFGEFGRSSRDLYRNPLRIELSPGRLSKFFEKWRVRFSGKSGCWYDDMMIWWYDDTVIWWHDIMIVW